MNSNDSTEITGGRKILLIGNAASVLSEAQIPAGSPVQVCPDILDGIEAAVKKPFDAIAVVMANAATNLRAGLVALRNNTNSKILLLARMHEEPQAIELIGSAGNGTGLADDYIIYPVGIERLCASIHGASAVEAMPRTGTSAAAVREKMERLEKLATEDDLTGLKNRRYIFEFAKQIIERAKKDNGRVTVLIFDIDNFKHYNDVYGHAAGDEVLRQASLLIRRCCRKHDAVGRLGGDEFAAVFWDDPKCDLQTPGTERRSFNADHPKEVISIARRFRRELENTELGLLGPEGKGTLTISGGLATLTTDGSTTEELFAKADLALLDAKRSGKNRIYIVGRPENNIEKIK